MAVANPPEEKFSRSAPKSLLRESRMGLICASTDANARASGHAREGPARDHPLGPARVYAATVTSPLELSGHIWPGLLEMTMTMHFAGAEALPVDTLSRRDAFALSREFDRPTLVLDTEIVAENYRALKAGLGEADIHYAVKANPAREIVSRLIGLGSHFDAASRGEIELCLSLGARPETISFGNTVKRASDIAFAHAAGVTLFAADAEEELDKIAGHAPGAEVYIRLIVEASGADWPLTRKFGCAPDHAVALMDYAAALGLRPVGVSFHVGSQTRQTAMWAPVLDRIADVWRAAQDAGHALDLLNIGGGFPAFYGEEIAAPAIYAAQVREIVAERFGDVPRVMAE